MPLNKETKPNQSKIYHKTEMNSDSISCSSGDGKKCNIRIEIFIPGDWRKLLSILQHDKN